MIISINGNYGEKFDQKYRRESMEFLSQFDYVYPIYYPEFRGCSKHWNTMFINSSNDNVLFLSDDVHIGDMSCFERIDFHISNTTFLINNSFSHFVANRQEINELGWFDERLLAFGEEDGDYVWRYMKKYGTEIPSINIPQMGDRGKTETTGFKKGIHKYSKFNRDWIFSQKYIRDDKNGFRGRFDYPCKEINKTTNLYPHESFHWKNKNNL